MGLDMYLYKEKYCSTWRENLPEIEGFDDCETIIIKGEAIYWRKANAIHNWFVKNVQDNVDDCGNYYVTINQLKSLLKDIITVINSTQLVAGKVVNGQTLEEGGWKDIVEDGKVVSDATLAKTILPTSNGFFFGGTDYDEYYFDGLKITKEKLEKLLNSPDAEKYDYYYHSSW